MQPAEKKIKGTEGAGGSVYLCCAPSCGPWGACRRSRSRLRRSLSPSFRSSEEEKEDREEEVRGSAMASTR